MNSQPVIRDGFTVFDVRMRSTPEDIKGFYEVIDSMEVGQSAEFKCTHPKGMTAFRTLIRSRCNSYQSVRTGYKLESVISRGTNSIVIFKRKSGEHKDLSRFNCRPLVLREDGFSADEKRRSVVDTMQKNGPDFYESTIQRIRHLKAFKKDREPTKSARAMLSNMVNAGAVKMMPCGRLKLKESN